MSFDGRVRTVERRVLTVMERRAESPDSVRLEIVYLRLPAKSGTGRSPIVFLMGGPGVPAGFIGRIPPYWALFDQLSEEHDVVLLDQRGTGASSPSLACPAAAAPGPDLFSSNATLREALRSTYAACLATHRAAGVPPELFTISAVARDVDRIRSQLGVERISLLGFSFGTRLALEYARAFPERVDRVVLQGTLGFDDGVRFPTTLDSVLIRIGAAVAADSVARGMVPDLVSAVADRVRALRKAPVDVSIAGTRDSVRLRVGPEGFLAIVSGRVGDPRLPALLATLRTGDTRVIGAIAGATYRDLASGAGSTFGISMYCSAPAAEARYRLAERDAARSMFGVVFDNLATAPEFCRDVGLAALPASGGPQRPLDRPALFISGSLDDISGSLDDRTPAGNAEHARRYFTRSHSVLVENGGHELLPLELVQDLVVEFFATGTTPRQRLTVPPPRFLTIAEALLPPRRR